MFTASNQQHHHARPSSRLSSHGAWRLSGGHPNATRLRTPNLSEDGAMPNGVGHHNGEGGDTNMEEDPKLAEFKERFALMESRIADVLRSGDLGSMIIGADEGEEEPEPDGPQPVEISQPKVTPKKPARTIDEDDYGDDDDDNEDDEADTTSPLQAKSNALPRKPSASTPLSLQVPVSRSLKPQFERHSSTPSGDHPKTAEEIRKRLEEEKLASEERVKQSSYTSFYTLEADREAMIEQEKLDELDRQVESELSAAPAAGRQNNATRQGTLSSANLGASSLTLKNLISRIDQERHHITVSDTTLKQMLSEARKNRSKWASEDKIGREELYESAEKVLMELKARSDAGPFLNKVNKRDAPDYYNVIKRPMDIGTMLKKLKALQYKSKKEFVDDLQLIWSNCLKYNTNPEHYLRKKALIMRKETEKIVPLIPDITIRDRAEVEAEERRLQHGDDLDGIEDSDDEEPIMASRGRKAPGKKAKKGGSTTRKAPPAALEGSPVAENRQLLHSASTSNLKNEFLRADSDAPMDGSQNGVGTPPPGTLTPIGPHGLFSSGAPGSQADASETDNQGPNGITSGQNEDLDLDDLEYKTWKQVTKKDRAMVAAERHRLFRDNHLNPDEPALLRSRAGMRRWMRQRKLTQDQTLTDKDIAMTDSKTDSRPNAETIAEGIEGEEDTQLPDYYDPLTAIPDLHERTRWIEDADGQVIDPNENYMRMFPKGQFTSQQSTLTQKMEANMRQMQEVRKVCAKIGVVKQMQLQSQMYQNQFQKYDPQPFIEADIPPTVVADDGPMMQPYLVRAALQRSVGKIFYQAGFEEYQPSALDVATDIAGHFFENIGRILKEYSEVPKVKSDEPFVVGEKLKYKPGHSFEEVVLHALDANGMDVETLESYAKDEPDRLGVKLGVMTDRTKAYLAELLRPALDGSAGADGVGAFNDGSEQFVSGDFAEEMGEDFFGFKELGLDREFGLASLSVPLHLLQNRMYNAHQSQNANSNLPLGTIMEQPTPLEPVTLSNISNQIGLVQDFFLAKLASNNDEPLVEDEDLPVKQRFPKPRLPPTGKITSPRKRPIREQQAMAKKRRKLEEGKSEETGGPFTNGVVNGETTRNIAKPVGKLQLKMPPANADSQGDPEKDEGSAVGMMSPESLNAA